jgi:MFS family permease
LSAQFPSEIQAKLTPSRNMPHRVLAVLCLMYLVLYIDRANIATVAPKMTADLGLSNAQFGFAVSVFSFPYAIFQLFGGWLGDRVGARLGLIFCGVIVCVATVYTGFVGGLGSLVVARFILGLGEGSAFPTATRALADSLPRARWGFAQGLTHAAARLGNAIAPLIIVGFLAYTSWRGVFVILGILSLIWVALWRLVSPKTSVRFSKIPTSVPSVPWLRLAKRMAPVTAVDFCYGWTLWVFLTWIPTFFYKSFHLDLKHSALFSSGVLLGGVVGDTTGGYLSDLLYRRTKNLQTARRNVIVLGMLGAFCFLIPITLVHQLKTVAICLSLACFFSELVVAPIWAVPMDIAPEYAGTASGMMNFGFGVAGILSPVIFGKLLDLTHGWTVPFYGSLGLLILGAGASFFMRPDQQFNAKH